MTENDITPISSAIQTVQRNQNAVLGNLRASSADVSQRLVGNETSTMIQAKAFSPLSPVLQNALVVNEALNDLHYVISEPPNVLFVDETPATLAVQDIFEGLNLIQENAQLISEALRQLQFGIKDMARDLLANRGRVPDELRVPGEVAGTVPSARGAGAQAAPGALESAATTTAGRPATGGEVATSGATSPTSVAVLPTTSVTVPEELLSGAQVGLDPFSLPFVRRPDQTPYVLAAYETAARAREGEEAAPIDREVAPVQPVQPTRHIDQLVSSLFLRREMGRGQRKRSGPLLVAPVRAVKRLLHEVNEDLETRGSSLHLVLAASESGYALDVYNCASGELCVLEHNVHLDLAKMPSLLSRFYHESGLIVNVES